MRILLLATFALLAPALAGCLDPAGDDSAPAARSPYADLNGSIRAMTPEEIDVLANGKGGGYALPAELNGYPGPRHVLDLKDALKLTADQERAIARLFAAMEDEAKEAGARVLAEHAALEAAFRNRTITDAELEARGAALAAAYGEVRLVHLRAHLATIDVLTPHQVALYNEARGYGAADHGQHDHGSS